MLWSSPRLPSYHHHTYLHLLPLPKDTHLWWCCTTTRRIGHVCLVSIKIVWCFLALPTALPLALCMITKHVKQFWRATKHYNNKITKIYGECSRRLYVLHNTTYTIPWMPASAANALAMIANFSYLIYLFSILLIYVSIHLQIYLFTYLFSIIIIFLTKVCNLRIACTVYILIIHSVTPS